jgi:hypothetical protein
MKLYTEEQVKKAISIAEYGDYECEQIIDELTPIELPSDEEIEEESSKWRAPSQAFRGGAKWMSDLYFENRYRNTHEHIKYIESIDRTCELMETPKIVNRQNNCPLLSVTIKIWTTNDRWMIAELSYPIDHVIYR